MSILQIIERIEHERKLNTMLLDSLLHALDEEIQRIQDQKQNLREEFAERDASLLRLIEGSPHPVAVPQPVTDSEAA
jgi:hypothetical protein